MTAGDDLHPVELLSVGHDLSRFDSKVAVLDRWLRNYAHVARSASTAATYVLCRGERVVAYYALATNAVTHRAAPSRLRRGMPDPVPVVLLAQLAVDRSEQATAWAVTCWSMRFVAACEVAESSALGLWLSTLSTSGLRSSIGTATSATSTTAACGGVWVTSPPRSASEAAVSLTGQQQPRRSTRPSVFAGPPARGSAPPP